MVRRADNERLIRAGRWTRQNKDGLFMTVQTIRLGVVGYGWNLPTPVSLREGLCMTLPGIYASESARNGGAPTRIRYPWDTVNT